MSLYDDETEEKNKLTTDTKFTKLKICFDRVQKILQAQTAALDHIEKKVTTIQKRREEREKNPLARLQMKVQQSTHSRHPNKSNLLMKNAIKEQDQEDGDDDDIFEQELSRTQKINLINEEMKSTDDEAKFHNVQKLASKYNKKENFGKFRSHLLNQEGLSSDSDGKEKEKLLAGQKSNPNKSSDSDSDEDDSD